MTETYGFPLIFILLECKNRNLKVDWIDYYQSGIKKGMKTERLLLHISNDISDAYGSEYRDSVMERLNFYIKKNL